MSALAVAVACTPLPSLDDDDVSDLFVPPGFDASTLVAPTATTSAPRPPPVPDGGAPPDAEAGSPVLLEDGLDEESDRLAAATPSAPVDRTSIVLPNGKTLDAYLAERGLKIGTVTQGGVPTPAKGPQQRKNDIIAIMAAYGLELTARPTNLVWWSEGPNQPAQDGTTYRAGLAYVWGSRDHSARIASASSLYNAGTAAAPRWIPATCTEELHGLDCSGLIYEMANRASLPLAASVTSGALKEVKTWNAVLGDPGLEMQVVDASKGIENGDIVVWPGHVGMMLVDGISQKVVQSNGGPAYTCTQNTAETRGPRLVDLTQIRTWFTSSPTFLRIVVKLSGDWSFHIRCAGRDTDAAKVRLTINPNGGPFQALGNGTDYNGSPFGVGMEGTYDQASDKLEGRVASTFTNESRTDGFSLKLREDDTGYFSMTRVVDNGGCPTEGRLARVNGADASAP